MAGGNDWMGPREEKWTDYLPAHVRDPIAMNPMVNALSRYMTRPQAPPDDSQVPMPPTWFDRQHPSIQQGANLMGLLAGFLGRGGGQRPMAQPPAPQLDARSIAAAFEQRFGHPPPAGLPPDAMLRWIESAYNKAPAPPGAYGTPGRAADNWGAGNAFDRNR